MKCNLRNKPRYTYGLYEVDEVDNWFRGFEKELRRKLASLVEEREEVARFREPTGYCDGQINLIKRILGEDV